MAAAAAHSDAALCAGIQLVGERTGGRVSLGTCLSRRVRGNLSALTALAGAGDCGLDADLLCAQSEHALPANHGNDRAPVSVRDDLARGPAGGVAQRPRQGCKTASPAALVDRPGAGLV